MTHRVAILSLALPTLLVACQPDPTEELRNGIPRPETVEMKIPGASGQALTIETVSQALKGQTAEFYQLTYGVTHIVNGGGALVLLLVKQVVARSPTAVSNDTATWGPWTGPLEPLAWRVMVTKVGDHQYRYKFEGKPKASPDSAFITILSGTHTAALGPSGQPIEGFGRGDFTLDWDARATLPMPNLKEMGKAKYIYSRMGGGEATDVAAQLIQVRDQETTARIDVNYVFQQKPAADGFMDFVASVPASMGKPAGAYAIKSRWKQSGAGRADIKAASAALPTTLSASQCWDPTFAATFLGQSWDASGGYGSEGECAFTPAEYSKFAVN